MSGPLVADVLPPPTGVLDFVWLGPVGVALGVAALALAVWVGRTQRRRGRGWGRSIGLAALVFVGLDLLAYALVLATFSQRRERALPPDIEAR